MKYLILIGAMVLTGCGINGEQKLTTNDSKQEVEILGEAFTYVVVRLEFIQQIKDLCIDKHSNSPEELKPELIANCTFKNLNVISIDFNPIKQVNETFCNRDLDGLTEAEIAEINRVCEVLNG